MNEQQKTQYVAFMANFIKILADEQMPRTQAQQSALAAASCLLAVVFDLTPRDDTAAEDFAGTVINAAINSFYGRKADRFILN